MAIKRSFQKLNISNPLIEARDGIEALDFMRGRNGRPKLKTPLLVLLDLNMPRMNGIEFLTEIRADPLLCRTVVFVMSTSASADDRDRAYQKNIAGYILKEGRAQALLDTVGMLQSYWTLVRFPA